MTSKAEFEILLRILRERELQLLKQVDIPERMYARNFEKSGDDNPDREMDPSQLQIIRATVYTGYRHHDPRSNTYPMQEMLGWLIHMPTTITPADVYCFGYDEKMLMPRGERLSNLFLPIPAKPLYESNRRI